VLLGGVAVSVSNVVVSGKGRRYRRNWEQRRIGKSEVDRQLVASVTRAVYEIARFRDRGNTDYVVLRGDARQLVPKLGAFDLAVFSPPYPNSFDYTDVYNIELWVCGYLKRPSDNRTLRLETLTSHVQIARSYAKPKIASPTLAGVVNRLRKVRQRLWNRNIPDMVEAYFADMEEILRAIRTKLVPGGRAYIVVGDSQYAGIQIPVSTILTEFASHLGYSVVYERPFRSMRLSPQQGGRAELPETLLALARMR
jgi:hypothetical protein